MCGPTAAGSARPASAPRSSVAETKDTTMTVHDYDVRKLTNDQLLALDERARETAESCWVACLNDPFNDGLVQCAQDSARLYGLIAAEVTRRIDVMADGLSIAFGGDDDE
jgi:hypothetical protein